VNYESIARDQSDQRRNCELQTTLSYKVPAAQKAKKPKMAFSIGKVFAAAPSQPPAVAAPQKEFS